MKGPTYTGDEDLEGEVEKDLEWALNYGILEKDPVTGETREGPNVRDLDTGEIVPKPEPTITTRGFEYTKAEVNEEDLEAIKKQIKTPFVKTRIERLAKAINTGKYGAVGSLLAKQTGEPYRTLTEEERKIAAQAIIDELLKDIG